MNNFSDNEMRKLSNRKHDGYGILNEPDIGVCPSCKTMMALPRGMELSRLHTCPKCRAMSYGYKWLADKGKSAKARIDKFKEAVYSSEGKSAKP